MKKIVAFSFLILFASSIQAQNWQWAKSIHGPNADFASVSCIDNQGNSYVLGAFDGNSCIFDTDTLYGGGYTTHYIAKYSLSGNLIWAKKTGNNFSANCSSGIFKLVYDSLANSLLFAGAVGSYFQMNATTVTSSPGNMDAIFGKANLNGDILWYHTITGVGAQIGYTIDYDTAGNVYSVGTNNAQIQVGADTLSAGVFIIKYDSNGNQQLLRTITNSLAFQWTDLQVTVNNFYLSGYAIASFTFDTVQFSVTNQIPKKIISKFKLNGDMEWVKVAESFHHGTFGTRIALDQNENIYTICSIGDSATIGNLTVYKIGWGDMIITKHDSSGNFLWFRRIDMSAPAEGIWDIASDKVGDLYIIGNFGGTAHFGNNTVTSSAANDLFLAKYTPNGDCIGVDHFGNAKGLSVVVDNNNNPIVSGTFKNTVNIGATSFTSSGVYDAFVAKHAPITDIKTLSKTSNNQLFIHANPNTGKCNITLPADVMNEANLVLSIYNNQGSLIQKIAVNTSEQKIKINLEAEAAGIYTAVLSGGSKSYSGKIVFE
jgi:Secretion system C-terminal sorting domain